MPHALGPCRRRRWTAISTCLPIQERSRWVAVALQAIALGYLASLLLASFNPIIGKHQLATVGHHGASLHQLDHPKPLQKYRWGLGTEKPPTTTSSIARRVRCFNTNPPAAAPRVGKRYRSPSRQSATSECSGKKRSVVSLESRRYPSAVSSTRSLAARWLALFFAYSTEPTVDLSNDRSPCQRCS